MNAPSTSARPRKDPVPCSECGSTSRVGGGLCLTCLLHQGLDADTCNDDVLKDELAGIDVRDAGWRLGNYQILEEIGRGGMGVIYRARQRHSRRIVAVKRILTYHADSQETLVRFRREAEAVAKLDHPNILPIYEVGENEDGLPSFSMKFAAGGSLVDAGPALRNDPRRIVSLMAKVARAVQYAHEQGILHRDLKPGNILLDGRGEPLVSDFGLAKWLDTTSNLTQTLTIFGTPGYIAPEQANGAAAKLTPAADIYSLGAILFNLLTGRPPFLGEHALAVVKQASEKPAPKLRSLAPTLDRDLETICTKCLEHESNARYRSAGDLAEDLERWLAGRHIIARPVSAPARVWRWSRRNPLVAGMAALLLILGTAVGALIWNGPFAKPAESGIAVLPFESLSPDKENALFANGVYDGISTKLAKLADLKVISHKARSRKKSQIGLEPKPHLQRKPPSRNPQLRILLRTICTCEPKTSSMALRLARGQKKICSKPRNCSTKLLGATLRSLMPMVSSRQRMTGLISLGSITPMRGLNWRKQPLNQFAVCTPILERHTSPSLSICIGPIRTTTAPARSWLLRGARSLTNREFLSWLATSTDGRASGRKPSRNLKRRWNWIRAIMSYASKSPSLAKLCAATKKQPRSLMTF